MVQLVSQIALDDTQVFLAAPRPSQKNLAYVVVHNPAAATTYLNVWNVTPAPSGTPTEVAAGRVGIFPIASGANTTIPIGLWCAAGAVISASSGTDITGTPASALEVMAAWTSGE